MPREITWNADNTSSSSGIGGKSARDAHHLWLTPQQKLDPHNFHNVLFAEEASHLQLVGDAQPSTTGTIAQRPDVLTSQDNVSSPSRDVSSQKSGVKKTDHSDESRPEAPSFPDDQRSETTLPQNIEKIPRDIAKPNCTIDYAKIDEKRLLAMALDIRKLGTNIAPREGSLATRTYYDEIARCLDHVHVQKGGDGMRVLSGWLPNTEPPSDPNEALSQAVRYMREGTLRKLRSGTVSKLESYADEIEGWMNK